MGTCRPAGPWREIYPGNVKIATAQGARIQEAFLSAAPLRVFLAIGYFIFLLPVPLIHRRCGDYTPGYAP